MTAENRRWERAACGGWLAVSIAGLVWWTWGLWPDVLVDFGRELYVPWQIASGQTLYKDIAWFNGPLSPYFNALCFWLVGVSLMTLVTCNLILLVALTWMLFHLLEEISDPPAAATACFVFLTVFAFGQYLGNGNYNFICPYSHEMTHGVTLGVAAFFCLWLHARRGRTVYLAAAGLALGLTFLTKAEVFLATAVALAVGLWLHRPSIRPRQYLLLVGTAAVPPLVALALLSTTMPVADALKGTLGSWRYVFNHQLVAMRFYATWMGTLDVGESLRKMAGALGWHTLVFGIAAGLALLLREQRFRSAWAGIVVFAAMTMALAIGWSPVGWLEMARPLPVLILAACVTTGACLAKPGERDSPATIARGMLLVFAFVLMAKVILYARVAHYGFALVMPAAVVWVVVLLSWIPGWMTRRGGNGRVFRAAAMAVVLVGVAAHLYVSNHWYKRKSVVVGRGADAFTADMRGQFVNLALDSMAHRLKPGDTVAAFPEGVMLNYLARRRNPTPYINFMPPEMVMFDERRMLDAYRAHPPDYVLLVHKDSSGYGPRFFGTDYGREMFGWIAQSYEVVEQFGDVPLRDDRFGILLLRRRLP